MSRPFRKVITRYNRFKSATCRLFGCRVEVYSPNVLYMGGFPLTMGDEHLTMGDPQ